MKISSFPCMACIQPALLFCLVGLAQQPKPYHNTLPKDITVYHAAVVSANPLATAVGLRILKEGGNAVDAAIAVQLTLAVVYPEAGNIGGGGFTVIHLNSGKNYTIDYREEAPGKAYRDMFLDKQGNADPHLSQDGHLACGVPGTVAGLFAAYKFASLPFRELIEPAIHLARNGFAISAEEAKMLNDTRSDFLKLNTIRPVFVRHIPWKAGDTLIQKDLAHTLELIRDNGSAGFYGGETAKRIVKEMIRGGGMISSKDLLEYAVKWRNPLSFDYKKYVVLTMPLPSSGGIMLEQMLGMLSAYQVGKMGFETPQSVQLMTEIERRCYADRAKFLGDPDFVKVPVKTLVSPEYLRQRMLNYSPGKATPSKDIQAGKINPESEETTQVSVLDSSGNAVSLTYTLNGLYGSRVVVGGAGFLLNNEMDDFSAKPGSPNMFGLVGAEADAIAPHKRMLSSMTP
ncbi:MAG TPA: gamma-glutamyltransferase, partial [Chitinophagaceae bacterium]|nr:gamma-glutamyltransferase [Chitinophagaceae bacterium]